jgi:hypothetical protein
MSDHEYTEEERQAKREARMAEVQRLMATTPREFQYDTHKDCSHCPQHAGSKCDLIGTGIHEPMEVHLTRVHGYSQDKMAGMALAARLFGKTDAEAYVLAHQGILLFAPRTSADA